MKKLYRSQTDRKIAGIFGGIAETYSHDATLWRLGAVFLGVATGILPLLVTYIIGWIIIPLRSGTVDLRTPPAGAGG